MKTNRAKYSISLIMLLLCIVISGCGYSEINEIQDTSSENGQNENCNIIEVNIHEQGGEDGRNNDWKIYQENDKYYLSYNDNGSQYFEHNYNLPGQNIIEITEDEYGNIMSYNYDKLISEFDEAKENGIVDNISFQLELKYQNDYVKTTQANMTKVTVLFIDILIKHK